MGSYYETPCTVCSETLTVPVRYDGQAPESGGAYRVLVSVDHDSPKYLALRQHFRNHPRGGGEPLGMVA